MLLLCEFYNRLRARKIEDYRKHKVSLTMTDLRAIALQERRGNTELQSVHSQVVQNVADRVSTAFRNYFKGKARFPKTKKNERYLSMTYPQSGFTISLRRSLYLSGIGHVRIFMHRPCLGNVKRLTIKYEAGEWYAIFITDRETPQKQSVDTIPDRRIRGADLGLEMFAVLDNAQDVKYPQYLRQSEERIRALQRKLSRKKGESRRWKQLRFLLAKVHTRVKRQREDWQNKRVSEIFAENDILILEKLNIEGMLKNHHLAKSISDASFGGFARKAIFKAEMLGKHFVAVDPWGTTQFCYNCLEWTPKNLAERKHICSKCGANIPRDLNSAKLIRRLGILSARTPPSDGGSSFAEPRPLLSLRGMASQGVEARSH